jgi:CO dehydrogenase maturation factor
LVVEIDEAVVLDLEAGVEHIGRGTARQVDVLLVVADSNLKSLEIAKHIRDMAMTAGMQQIYLVGNRVMNEEQKAAIKTYADDNGMEVLDFIPFDVNVTESDMKGKTPLLNKEIPSIKTIDNICELLIKKKQNPA